MATQSQALVIKLHKGVGGYGITRGRKWHAWTYPTREAAQKIADRMSIAGERAIEVNVARSEPIGLVPPDLI